MAPARSVLALGLAVALCLTPLALAASCAPGDVSIVQDGAYTDMASTWMQLTADSGIKEDRMAVFSAEFRLFCKSEAIKDADLSAAVVYRSGSEAYVAKEGLKDVAVISNSTGSYQVSFALPEEQMPSGEYKAEIYFSGGSQPVASISMFHSVPLVHGRHMEVLATVVLAGLSYYVMSQSASQ